MAGTLAVDELRKRLVCLAAVRESAQQLVDVLLADLRELGFIELPSFEFHYEQTTVSKQSWHTTAARQYVQDPATDNTLTLEVLMGVGWSPTLGSDVLIQRVRLGAAPAASEDNALAEFDVYERALPFSWTEVLTPGDLAGSAARMGSALEALPDFSGEQRKPLASALTECRSGGDPVGVATNDRWALERGIWPRGEDVVTSAKQPFA